MNRRSPGTENAKKKDLNVTSIIMLSKISTGDVFST